MAVTSHCFGHPCYYDFNAEQWLYVDTGRPIASVGGEVRPCPECNQYPTVEGYDPCVGFIPGASSACCGHGVTDPVNMK